MRRGREALTLLLSDEGAPAAIAQLLGATLEEAPFRLPEDESAQTTVYRIGMTSTEHDDAITLLVWPALSRIDVHLRKSTWTLKGISDVHFYPGVEVLFRRDDPPAVLFVSVHGRVALVS